jgi:hypothetical protein
MGPKAELALEPFRRRLIVRAGPDNDSGIAYEVADEDLGVLEHRPKSVHDGADVFP